LNFEINIRIWNELIRKDLRDLRDSTLKKDEFFEYVKNLEDNYPKLFYPNIIKEEIAKAKENKTQELKTKKDKNKADQFNQIKIMLNESIGTSIQSFSPMDIPQQPTPI